MSTEPTISRLVEELPPRSLLLRPVDAARGVLRFGLVLTAIVLAWIGYWLAVDRRSLRARALWLHRLCIKLAKISGVRVEIVGERPARGLIVSNHLTYLDIIVLSAAAGSAFVSKAEVMRWPFFGRSARYGGTVFVDRQRRGAVTGVAEEMHALLSAGVPLVLFPEGTSSGGEGVLPFKASLFAPAVDLRCEVTACGLDYTLPGGSVADEVAYWRDHSFAPHLLNLLSKTGLSVRIAFGPAKVRDGDRKEIARELHAEVVALRAG